MHKTPARKRSALAIAIIGLLLAGGATTPVGGADDDPAAEIGIVDTSAAVPLARLQPSPGTAALPWLDGALSQRLLAGDEVPIETIPGFPYNAQDLQANQECVPLCPALPYTHIRPGAALGATQLACTANFVFHDTTSDRLAIGTAGHCTAVGQTHTTLLVNAENAIGFRTIGETIQSTGSAGAGTDFALIEIDETYRGLVEPSVSALDGPCAWRASSGLGDPIQQYGHGLAWGTGGQTRHGVVAGNNGDHIVFLAAPGISWGDSGSPARFADAELSAAAVTTHAIPMTPYAIGTSMPRVFEIMDAWGMGHWELSHSPNCL